MSTSMPSFLMIHPGPLNGSLVLATSGGAAWMPGDPAQPQGTAGADGGATGANGGTPPGLFPPQFIWIMLGMIVIMLVVSGLGPRRERKRREAMLSALKKHDRVQTTGGLIGSIVEIKPETVVLKVDESSNTRVTFSRASIQHVLSSRDDAPAAEPAEK